MPSWRQPPRPHTSPIGSPAITDWATARRLLPSRVIRASPCRQGSFPDYQLGFRFLAELGLSLSCSVLLTHSSKLPKPDDRLTSCPRYYREMLQLPRRLPVGDTAGCQSALPSADW